ncbi:MAG: Ion transport 2 domain protein [Frankiales bacterium]|nr:Ion transport 2 domain protein [Frankiales bacterium]
MLLRLLGAALLLFAAVDVFLTVLLPSARGVLSGIWAGGLWRVASAFPGALRHRLRQAVGPLSLVATIASWVVLLWVAYALLYFPDVGSLGYSSDVKFEGSDWVAALYLSGTMLTTLGLGDVAAQTDGLRMLAVLESGAGLALFTVSIGYLPALYTVISDLRTSAEAVSDLRATTPDRAARLLSEDAGMTLESVRRDVISARQHLLRFPVLHHFHPPHGQSVLGVVEGATMLWVVARFGLAGEHHAGVRRQAEALELALCRLVDDVARHVGDAGHGHGLDAARDQVQTVRAAVRELDDWQHADDEVDGAALHDLARTNAVMTRYARMHGYEFPSTDDEQPSP